MADKDKSKKPPGIGRRAVIWRAPKEDAAPATETGRRLRRGLPLPMAGVLIAALVGVGLYAAWPTIKSELWNANSERDAAAIPVPAPQDAKSAKPNGDEAPRSHSTASAPPQRDTRTAALEDGAPSASPEQSRTSSVDPSPGDAVLAAESQDADASGMTDPTASVTERADPPASAGTAVTRPPSDPVSPAAAGGNLLAADELGTVRARLDALEAQTADAESAEGAVRTLEQRVRALESDPARARLGPALAEWAEQRAALEARLTEVTARVSHVEAEATRQATVDSRLVALVFATGELTAALGTSRRFAPALDTLHGIAGEDREIEAALARLAPFAATGVSTLDGLAARFPETANAIIRAALATEDADWIDDTVTKLRQLVTIRRTGGVIDPASLDGRLVAAETALAAGDLARAIAIIEELGPEAAMGAEDWLRGARARREADAALADLLDRVNARVGARWAAVGATP